MGKKKGNQSAKAAKTAGEAQEAPPDEAPPNELGIENMAPGQDSGSEEKAPEMSNVNKPDGKNDSVQAHPPTARHTDIHEHAEEMKAAAKDMEENAEVLHDCPSEPKDEGDILEVPTKQEEAARIEDGGADDPSTQVSAESEEVGAACVVALREYWCVLACVLPSD